MKTEDKKRSWILCVVSLDAPQAEQGKRTKRSSSPSNPPDSNTSANSAQLRCCKLGQHCLDHIVVRKGLMEHVHNHASPQCWFISTWMIFLMVSSWFIDINYTSILWKSFFNKHSNSWNIDEVWKFFFYTSRIRFLCPSLGTMYSQRNGF